MEKKYSLIIKITLLILVINYSISSVIAGIAPLDSPLIGRICITILWCGPTIEAIITNFIYWIIKWGTIIFIILTFIKYIKLYKKKKNDINIKNKLTK